MREVVGPFGAPVPKASTGTCTSKTLCCFRNIPRVYHSCPHSFLPLRTCPLRSTPQSVHATSIPAVGSNPCNKPSVMIFRDGHRHSKQITPTVAGQLQVMVKQELEKIENGEPAAPNRSTSVGMATCCRSLTGVIAKQTRQSLLSLIDE